MLKIKAKTVNEYIDTALEIAQKKLLELHSILKKVAPNAIETIKWGCPVFEENRILFAFKAFKSHINFMPTNSAMEPFKEELANYNIGKDTIQLPYDKPLPKALIRKIAAYRAKDVRENDTRWM